MLCLDYGFCILFFNKHLHLCVLLSGFFLLELFASASTWSYFLEDLQIHCDQGGEEFWAVPIGF